MKKRICNQMKKAVSLFLTIVMMLSIIPIGIFDITATVNDILRSSSICDGVDHTYDNKNISSQYLKSEATCVNRAIYYYSCSCGKRGERIFTSGSPLGHSYGTAVIVNLPNGSSLGNAYQTCSRCSYKNVQLLASCLTCEGDGNVPKEVECPKCINGTEAYCPDCDGTGGAYGYYDCNKCGGNGRVHNGREFIDCPYCDAGDRYYFKNCTGCDGKGKYEISGGCNNCNATGNIIVAQVSCPDCSGKGYQKYIKIQFDLLGGSNGPVTQESTSNQLVITSQKPKKSGYVFVGWNTLENDKNIYVPGSTYSGDSTTFFAVWLSACVECGGQGYFTSNEWCPSCNGLGTYDKKIYKCRDCGTTDRINDIVGLGKRCERCNNYNVYYVQTLTMDCLNCVGGLAQNSSNCTECSATGYTKLMAPTLVSKTGTQVELLLIEGMEYSLDGTTWQSSNIFKDLSPATSYTFYQRVANNGSVPFGATSDSLTVMTACASEEAHKKNSKCVCTICGVELHTLNENCICTYCKAEKHVLNKKCICISCGIEKHNLDAECVCIGCGKKHSLSEYCVCLGCGTQFHQFESDRCRVCNGTLTDWDGSVAKSFERGSGTSTDPYIISTGAQLAYLASQVNAGTDFKDCYFELANDIDLRGIDWAPIGNGNYYFGGIFDGKGCVIKNLAITKSYHKVGLFGNVNRAKIFNIGVENININITYSSNLSFVGGLVGYVYESTISNCYVKGSVFGYNQSSDYYMFAGGLIGGLYSSSSVANSYSNTTVQGALSSWGAKNSFAGGLIGVIYTSSATNTVAIENCYTVSTVRSVHQNNSQYAEAGGLIGISDGFGMVTVSNCFADCNVSVAGNNKMIDGFLANPNNRPMFRDCYYMCIDAGSNYSGVYVSTTGNFKSQTWLMNTMGWDFSNTWIISNGQYPTLKVFSCNHRFTKEDKTYLKSAATCISPAVYYKCCEICGRKGTATFEYGSTVGHSYTRKVETDTYKKSGATCTEAAVYYYCCATCNMRGTTTYTSESELGHTGGTATCLAKAICTRCSQSYGNMLDHVYTDQDATTTYLKSAATCTSKAIYYKNCATCDKVGTTTFEYGSTLAHNYSRKVVTDTYKKSAATCTDASVYYYCCATCEAKGSTTYTNGSKLGHTGGTATCTAKAICTRCSQSYGNMLDHVYTDQDATATYLKSAATCTSKAVYYKNCATCDKAGTTTFEYGAIKSHSYIKNVDDVYLKSVATCTSKAIYYKSCSTCGIKGSETFEAGGAPSHDYQSDWSSDAASHWHECSTCGDKKDKDTHTVGAAANEFVAQTCTVCGYVIVPALGHTHDYSTTWSNDTDCHWYACSSCSEPKDKTAHSYKNACDTDCDVCGYVRTIAHSYNVDWSKDAGRHWYECSVCGDKKNEAAHIPGADATETTNQTCTVCGYVIKESHRHTEGEWIIDKEATTTEEGSKHQVCSVCGATIKIETIPKLEIISGSCGENLTWTFNTSTGLLTVSGNGVMNDYTSIKVPWYAYGEFIQKVIIEEGVTSIGEYAFHNCTNLVAVIISNGVKSIGKCAFNQCYNLTEVTMSNGVASIGYRAFGYCEKLTRITFPDSLTFIGESAFFGCVSVTELTLPSSVQGISYDAFAQCTALTKITILSKSIHISDRNNDFQTIPSKAVIYGFKNSGADVYASSYNKTFVDIEGSDIIWLFDESTSTLTVSGKGAIDYINARSVPWASLKSSIKNVIVESGITSISQFAFSDCKNLTEITIPDSVTSIAASAFSGCTQLIQKIGGVNYVDNWVVGIDSSVTNISLRPGTVGISDRPFFNQTNLAEVIIPDGVTSIGKDAFYKCTKLENITIPNSVTFIGEYAFGGCTKLMTITIYSKVVTIADSDSTFPMGSTIYGYAGSTVETYAIKYGRTFVSFHDHIEGEWIIDKEATATEEGRKHQVCSICGATIKIETIPKLEIISGSCGTNLTWTFNTSTGLLTVSGNGAMNYTSSNAPWSAYRESIQKVIIEEGVTSIATCAFQYQRNLKSVVISYGVTVINDYAFYGCNSLMEVMIPNSVTKIGKFAFTGCESLTNITLPSSVKYISESAFSACRGLTSITIPESVENLGVHAFIYCDNLTSITFESPITGIFDKLNDLGGTIPNTATIYGYSGSNAEEYAKAYNRTFVALDEPQDVPGDIDSNGTVDASDAETILKYITGHDIEVVEDALDVNGDGQVNIRDAATILLYLSGKNVELN